MIIITLGTFEIFHRGHLRLLKKCRELAGDDGAVFVGLNTDEFIYKYKGFYPAIPYEERKAVIEETGLVDFVIPNDQEDGTAKGPIISSGCDLVVIGSDWLRKPYLKQIGVDPDWMDDLEIGLCYVPYTRGISTTEIKKRIDDSNSSSN